MPRISKRKAAFYSYLCDLPSQVVESHLVAFMGGTDIFSFSQVNKSLFDISKNTSGYKIGYGDYLIRTCESIFEDIQYQSDSGAFFSGTDLKMYAVKMLRKHLETPPGMECKKKTKKCVQTAVQDIKKLRCAVIELREQERLREQRRLVIVSEKQGTEWWHATQEDTSSCDSNCEHPIYQDHHLAQAWKGVIKMTATVDALTMAMQVFPSWPGVTDYRKHRHL